MPEARETYIDNYMKATRGTGRLMLFACDQKIEHLNKDFYGEGIDISDAEPEHLFEIGSQGTIGVLAGQRGLVAQYAPDYPEINYLIKMNSKTNLVKGSQDDPYSPQLYDLEAVLAMREAGVNIVGLGYTIYLGSEYESTMMAEAGELIAEAHAAGLLVVLWIYPRGKAVADEKDPDLIAGAAGVALCLGADFVKVNPPHEVEGQTSAEGLAIASKAAGRTGLVCAGGSKADANVFLTELHNQIHIGGACGNATGRNIHMRSTEEAIRLCNAISAITLGDWSVEDAEAVFRGEKDFRTLRGAITLHAVLAHRETSKGKAWREGQCLALFNLSLYSQFLIWAARLVQCDLFRARYQRNAKRVRRGRKTLANMAIALCSTMKLQVSGQFPLP